MKKLLFLSLALLSVAGINAYTPVKQSPWKTDGLKYEPTTTTIKNQPLAGGRALLLPQSNTQLKSTVQAAQAHAEQAVAHGQTAVAHAKQALKSAQQTGNVQLQNAAQTVKNHAVQAVAHGKALTAQAKQALKVMARPVVINFTPRQLKKLGTHLGIKSTSPKEIGDRLELINPVELTKAAKTLGLAVEHLGQSINR